MTALEAGAEGPLRRNVVRLMLARLGLSLGLLAVTLALVGVGREGAEAAERGLYGTLAGAFVASLGYAAGFRFVRRLERFAALQLVTDLVIVTALVYFSGGAESIYSFLYLPITVQGAILFDRWGAYGSAGCASLAYALALALAEHSGMREAFGPLSPGSPLSALWVMHTSALLIVALLSSALAREVRVTEEALHESASDLRELRRLHERTVECLTSGLLTTDGNGRVTSFNPEAERITGIGSSEALGRDVEAVLPGARGRVMGSQAGEGRQRIRLPFCTREGRERHLGLSGSILRDDQGRAAGHVVIFQDVSDVVAMEQVLRRSERLAATGQLAADMAHEIRNPLAAISGSVEMLRAGLGQGPEHEERRSLMGIVLREIERLDKLIADFLRYARPQPPKRVPVQLSALVGEVLHVFEASRPEGIRVAAELEEGLTVLADPTQIRQLLWNLILNAAQAMEGGGELGLRASRLVSPCPQGPGGGGRNEAGEGAGRVEIAVSDTGAGIPPDVLDRIFDPFFTTKRGGTGLGLATVHRVVEGNEGELRVESRVGEGTTFRVWLQGVDGRRERRPTGEVEGPA